MKRLTVTTKDQLIILGVTERYLSGYRQGSNANELASHTRASAITGHRTAQNRWRCNSPVTHTPSRDLHRAPVSQTPFPVCPRSNQSGNRSTGTPTVNSRPWGPAKVNRFRYPKTVARNACWRDSGDNGDGFQYRKPRILFKTVSVTHHTLLALAWTNPYFTGLSRPLAMQATCTGTPPCPPTDLCAALHPVSCLDSQAPTIRRPPSTNTR